MAELPTGTITFLFTDIEGSTRQWQQLGEVMGAAVARHDRLVRECIEAGGGYVFKTVGDAFCAAFWKADDCVRCALQIRRVIEAEDWAPVEMKVRMGIHAGIAQERDGDYFGNAVNKTARVEAAANGGQIIASATVRELLDDAPGVRCTDLGRYYLKDIDTPVQLWQLDDVGSARTFPPVRTQGLEIPNNLPARTTSFVGRDRATAELMALVADARVLTVLGPGGTGKTRIALEVASRVETGFEDGKWFVDLSRISDPAGIEAEIAASLGLAPAEHQPLSQQIHTRLAGRRTLLILDNCEHLIEAAAETAAELVRDCGELTVLATSREALMIEGEVTYRLDPLETPGSTELDSIGQYEAVTLFLERVKAVKPAFQLDSDAAATVAEICSRLDGMPLALELAAAQMRFMSLTELAGRIGEDSSSLRSRSRGVAKRQRSMKDLIDWSWNLLPEEERRLWEDLSLLRSPFPDRLAAAAYGSDPRIAIEGLILKSIVRLGETEDGSSSYRMLETIRDYGAGRAAESGETDLAFARLMEYWSTFAADAHQRLRPVLDMGVYADLDRYYPNLALTLRRAFEPQAAEYAERATQTVIDLYDYFLGGRKRTDDIRYFADRIEERGDTLGKREQGYLALMRLAIQLTDFQAGPESEAYGRAAFEAAQETHDIELECRTVSLLTQLLTNAEEFDEALALVRGLPALERYLEDPVSAVTLLSMIGRLLVASHVLHPVSADAYLPLLELPPLAQLAENEDRSAAPNDLLAAGMCFLEAALESARQTGSEELQVDVRSEIHNILFIREDFEEAARGYEAELAFRRRYDYPHPQRWVLEQLADIACMVGDKERALILLSERNDVVDRLAIPTEVLLKEVRLARVEAWFGDPKAAVDRCAQTLPIIPQSSFFATIAYSQTLSQNALRIGDLASARTGLVTMARFLNAAGVGALPERILALTTITTLGYWLAEGATDRTTLLSDLGTACASLAASLPATRNQNQLTDAKLYGQFDFPEIPEEIDWFTPRDLDWKMVIWYIPSTFHILQQTAERYGAEALASGLNGGRDAHIHDVAMRWAAGFGA